MGLALRVVAAACCSFGLTVLVCAMAILAVQAAGGFALPPLIAPEMRVIAPGLIAVVVCLSTVLGLWAVLEVKPREEPFHPAWCFAIGLSLVLGSLALAAFTSYLDLFNPVFAIALGALGGVAIAGGLASAIYYSVNRIVAAAIVAAVVVAAAGIAFAGYHAFTTPGGQFGPGSGP